MTGEEIRVKQVLRETYCRHQPFTTLAFADFLGVVASAKNMLTRYQKGTMACGEAVLVNAIVTLANAVGGDTTVIFTTPELNELQYPVVRSILHFLGLPYEAGPLDERFTAYLNGVAAGVRRGHFH